MSEPLTVTEIDQQTKDELQPPCDIQKGQPDGGCVPSCDRPASWVVAVASNCISPAVVRLYCDGHAAKLIAGALVCLRCGEFGTRTERLRAVSMERL